MMRDIDAAAQQASNMIFQYEGKTTKALKEEYDNNFTSMKNLKPTPKNEKLKARLTATNFIIERILATRGERP